MALRANAHADGAMEARILLEPFREFLVAAKTERVDLGGIVNGKTEGLARVPLACFGLILVAL